MFSIKQNYTQEEVQKMALSKKEDNFKFQLESLEYLQKEFYDVANEKGWHGEGNEKPFTECILLIHSELSEVVEEYRNHKGTNEIYYGPDGKPEGIPIELADVFIRLLDTCEQFGIDLAKAVETKNEFNKTRPKRHGGKKL